MCVCNKNLRVPGNRANWELEVFRQAAIEEVARLPASDKKTREFVLRGPGDKNFTIQVKERVNIEKVSLFSSYLLIHFQNTNAFLG